MIHIFIINIPYLFTLNYKKNRFGVLLDAFIIGLCANNHEGTSQLMWPTWFVSHKLIWERRIAVLFIILTFE